MPGAAVVIVLGGMLFPIALLILALLFDVAFSLWAVWYVAHDRWVHRKWRPLQPLGRAVGEFTTIRVGVH
jgi:hypothetical protein